MGCTVDADVELAPPLHFWKNDLKRPLNFPKYTEKYCLHAPKTQAPLFLRSFIFQGGLKPDSFNFIFHCIVILSVAQFHRPVLNQLDLELVKNISAFLSIQSFRERSSSCYDATPKYTGCEQTPAFLNSGCKLLHNTSQHKIKKTQI